MPIFGIMLLEIKFYMNKHKNGLVVVFMNNEVIDSFFKKIWDVPIFGIQVSRGGLKILDITWTSMKMVLKSCI